MKLFQFRKPSKFLQGKKHRNRRLFKDLMRNGYTPAESRRMIVAGNKLNMQKLSEGSEVTAATIYAACYGTRSNPTGQAILADALRIPIKELFPENEATHG